MKNIQLRPAVGYLRMSDKKQDKSIPEQQAEIEAFAARHGFRIVRWYKDEGISGWKGDRADFQRLITDAETLHDFEAVLCWDQDRFSRFDPMEANYYWFILRRASVKLVTVAQGELDFSELGGWLKASVEQHGKSQYVKDLSRNVLRGRLAKARNGFWQGNRAPYGYRIADKKLSTLERATDGTAETVQRIFELYADADSSLWDIAHTLNSEGVPPPKRGKWRAASVRCILRRECYATGKLSQLCNPKGQFHSVIDGEIVRMNGKAADRGAGLEISCPTIVSAELWQRAQKWLTARKKNTTPAPPLSRSVLTGILYCGNCGGQMYGSSKPYGRGAIPGDRTYWCSTYHHHGRHLCTRNIIHELPILEFLVPRIQEALLSPDNFRRIEKSIRRQLAAEAQRPAIDPAIQLRRLAAMDTDIAAAVRQLKRTPDDLYEMVLADLRSLRESRDRLATLIALDHSRGPIGDRGVDDTVAVAVERATRIADILRSPDRQAVRHVLLEIVERIDLWFEPIPGKKIVRSAFLRGEVQFKDSAQLLHPNISTRKLGKSLFLVFQASDLSPVQFDSRRTPGVDRGEVFLRGYLADGPRRSRDCEEAGVAAGLSRSTIRNAARRMGIAFDGSGTWVLPG